MTGAMIKALGGWGSQNGLLSVAELDTLMALVRGRVLEVGHYYGLSTMAIVEGLRRGPDPDWSLLTVDAHIPDAHVRLPAPIEAFTENWKTRFDDPRVEVRFIQSETLEPPLDVDQVFYDGSHEEEQWRFTKAVIASPRITTFIFDDRDFEVPAECHILLKSQGWVDRSPPLSRRPEDKMDPETMTLGVFVR